MKSMEKEPSKEYSFEKHFQGHKEVFPQFLEPFIESPEFLFLAKKVVENNKDIKSGDSIENMRDLMSTLSAELNHKNNPPEKGVTLERESAEDETFEVHFKAEQE